MLIKASLEDVEKYGELAYSLALQPEKSGYPTYCDGIKTKPDFFTAARKAAGGENAELLLFYLNGQFEGWISYYWIPEDKYIQTDGFAINHGAAQALAELLDRIGEALPGYTAYLGFPGENREAAVFLEARGCKCIEQAWNHSFFFENYRPAEHEDCVERISRMNFHKFRAVYHAPPETYWNCDRIFDSIDEWTIFVYDRADSPAAAVFLTGNGGYYEIYGMEFADDAFQEDICRALLTASLNACRRMGGKYLTYFCGERERRVLSEMGFRCVGRYVLYTTPIG